MLAEQFLLARDAESLFWLARSVERIETMARLIDVTQSFESPGREAEAWYALVRINSDEENYAARGLLPEDMAVKRFYLLDRTNPTSIQSAIAVARDNARVLRPLIPTEVWRQLNIFHRFITGIGDADLVGDALSRLCTRLKDGVQAHSGVAEGTVYRDQGWHFYELGRLLERADQTTRLLDIKYQMMLPREGEAKRIADLTQWGAVLRAVAGHQAFKRLSRAAFSAEEIIAFLLRDPSFPRSVLLCIRRMEQHLDDLRRLHGLARSGVVIERVLYLRELLLSQPVAGLLTKGLHDFLDLIQLHLQELASEIGRLFFRDWRPTETR